MEEFSDSYLSRSLGTEASEAEETQKDPQITTDAGIELDDFPWVTGYVPDVETSAPIASGTQ